MSLAAVHNQGTKHRCLVRVVDHHPGAFHHFCARRSELNLPADGPLGARHAPVTIVLLAACWHPFCTFESNAEIESGYAVAAGEAGESIYMFGLTLQDATGELDAAVYDEDGTTFFGVRSVSLCCRYGRVLGKAEQHVSFSHAVTHKGGYGGCRALQRASWRRGVALRGRLRALWAACWALPLRSAQHVGVYACRRRPLLVQLTLLHPSACIPPALLRGLVHCRHGGDWMECCLKGYTVNKGQPKEARMYRVFDTQLRPHILR